MIVATAGHVDHGKSTLVRLLTGIDPDRWQEEKRRGLTIDLGFASMEMEIPGGPSVLGFVDVPGHRRFVPNMLAGCGSVDMALLVVSAREGWMPQTEEHLAILDLLGVHSGVVAITHADTVDPDTVELAKLEVSEALAGTGLSGAAMVTTSSTDASGIEYLRESISSVACSSSGPTGRDSGRPRLWIDRSFLLKGSGRVVTGTLTGGSLRVGDDVVIAGGGGEVSAHVRGLQVHGRSTEVAEPGHRVGVSLTRLDEAPQRGQALVVPGQWASGKRWQAAVWPVRGRGDRLEGKGGYEVFVGTAHASAQLRFGDTGADLAAVRSAGDAVLARLHLNEALGPVAPGDRFILRDTGADETAGGGVILAVDADLNRYDSAAMAARWLVLNGSAVRGARNLAEQLVGEADGCMAASALATQVGPLAELEAGDLLEIGHWVVSADALHRRRDGLLEVLEGQASVPEPSDPLGRIAVDGLLADGLVERRSGTVQRPGTAGSEYEAARDRLLGALQSEPPHMMGPSELTAAAGVAQRHVGEAVRDATLVDLGGMVVTPQRFAELVEQVRSVLEVGPASLADFREGLGLSRKYLLPLLDTLDARGLTHRNGETRTWSGN